MTPFQAAGAAQAIEDAYILGLVLGHPRTTLANVAEALKVYEAIRLPAALKVQADSATIGQINSFNDPHFAALAEVDHAELDPKKLEETMSVTFEMWGWGWVQDESKYDNEKKAVELLEQRLSTQ